MTIFNSHELQPYRDAILAKKLASMAFYRFGQQWEDFLEMLDNDFAVPLRKALG